MVIYQVMVIRPDRRSTLMDVCDNEEQMKKVTVLELRKKICDRLGKNPDDLTLIFTGQVLEDGRTLSSYGIQHMSTIHVLIRQPGGGGPCEPHGLGDRTGRNMSKERLDEFNHEPGSESSR
ncbi:ubiquilin-4-like [Sphaeramia orbicularis]|uniref:Ubiquilin-4-like n=1 Tax=Sphaeramia orbicularis TaxID=375764 RepID=A0A673CZT0_9TELE|nr:ubiquilin-4-like [Sphaeramia orbicularis]